MISILLSINACGGGAKKDTGTTSEPTRRFAKVSHKTDNSLSLIQTVAHSEKRLKFAPVYNVTSYKFEYTTINSQNRTVHVSGLIAVPVKDTPSPVLSFQHGTLFKNKRAPSFHLTPNKKRPEILFASLGYIVFSPDYLGYGLSAKESHPYLQKKPSADIVIDMLKAGQQWLRDKKIQTNQQLFLTGYSQGGYVTMAALKALQQQKIVGLTVTGAVLGAGPYDLYETLSILLRRTNNIPNALNHAAIEIIKYALLSKDTDIDFDSSFLERYFDKDKQDNLHQWKPNIPLKLFHGEEDDIVPIKSSTSTYNAMIGLGADVELVKCEASPSDHNQCTVAYLNYTLNYFEGLRGDL